MFNKSFIAMSVLLSVMLVLAGIVILLVLSGQEIDMYSPTDYMVTSDLRTTAFILIGFGWTILFVFALDYQRIKELEKPIYNEQPSISEVTEK